MGVYVKGMEMPKNCLECEIRAYDANAGEEYCPFSQMNCISIGLQKNCPLVKVPESHGRLIDENEVRTVMNWLLTQPQRPTWNDTYHAIQEMDAVIEAEGEG